jgi:hypothetical protein
MITNIIILHHSSIVLFLNNHKNNLHKFQV